MSETQAIKLSALTSLIQQTIDSAFAERHYWVMADITDHTFSVFKGNHYFSLVEKENNSKIIVAKIAGTAWGYGSVKIREFESVTGQKFTNDINILVKVSVDYHPTFGLKVTLLDIDPNFTLGKIEQQRQETLKKLLQDCSDFITKSGDRYYTRNNQLKLNTVIQRLAIVTSSNSAGFLDFQHTLENNNYKYQFHIDTYFTLVQGENNADQFYQRLLDVFNNDKKYDAVVILRGGGAQTDFLLFDTFQLGKIVAKFPIPIITGIGHQKNETIVDLMAHSPTKTPTKAAEMIIAHNRNFEEQLLSAQKKIIIKSQQVFSLNSQTISYLHSTIVNSSRNLLQEYQSILHQLKNDTINSTKNILFQHHRELVNIANNLSSQPRITIHRNREILNSLITTIHLYNKNYLQNKKGTLQHYESIIRLMHPSTLLKKGFAIIMKDNKIISDPKNIYIGNKLTILLAESEIKTTVTDINESDGKKPDL